MDDVLAGTVTVVVMDGHNRAIDGKLLEVGTAVTVDLSVEIREDSSLKKGILGEVNATNNVSGLELFASQMCYSPCRKDFRRLTMICSVSAK